MLNGVQGHSKAQCLCGLAGKVNRLQKFLGDFRHILAWIGGGAFFCFSPLFFAPFLVKIILPGFLSLFPSSLTKLVFYLSAVFTLPRNHNRHPCRCVRPLPSIPSHRIPVPRRRPMPQTHGTPKTEDDTAPFIRPSRPRCLCRGRRLHPLHFPRLW